MTDPSIENLRRASTAVYLACEESVAADISNLLRWGASEIERLEFELKAARNEIEIADGEIERRSAVTPHEPVAGWQSIETAPEGVPVWGWQPPQNGLNDCYGTVELVEQEDGAWFSHHAGEETFTPTCWVAANKPRRPSAPTLPPLDEVALRIAADLATIISEAEKHGTLPRLKSVAVYFDETELRTIIKSLRVPALPRADGGAK